MQIITFDFHNTVAHCDPWFELEVRTLPAAVLSRLAGGFTRSRRNQLMSRATAEYRFLRKHVIHTGGELEAQECVEHVFREIGYVADQTAIATSIDHLMRNCLEFVTPVPGVTGTITKLIEAGMPVGIVSSAVYHPFLEWSLERFGLLDRLAFVVTSASSGHCKSTPRIYADAYEQAAAETHLGVHVGDSPRWDVTTAKQAGLGTVLYAAGPEPRLPGQDDAEPDLILDSLEGAHVPLLKLLESRRTGDVQE